MSEWKQVPVEPTFEGWYQEYAARITGNPKKTARDAYEAGLKDAAYVAQSAEASEHESIIRACAFRLREVDSEYLAGHLESLTPERAPSTDSFDTDILKSLFHAAQIEKFDAWCGLVRAFLTGSNPHPETNHDHRT